MDPQHSAQDIIRCDLCETAEVQMHCDLCDVNLCIPCIGRHVSDDYDEHKVVPFKQRKTTFIFPKCTIHPKKSCKLQCNECNIPVCSVCPTSIQHKKHDLLLLSDIYDVKKKSVISDANELENSLLSTYKTLENDTETRISSLDGEYGNLTELVTKHGEEWHKEIDRIMEEMKNEINEMKVKHKSILKQHLHEIKQIQSLMDQTLITLKEIEESNKVTRILEYTSKINEFRKLPPKLQISIPTFTTGNINREQICQLFGSLSHLSVKREEGYGLKKMEAIGKELLELPELNTSISTEYNSINGVTCLSEGEIWIYGNTCDLKCFNIQGSVKKTVKTNSGINPNDVTLTVDGDLLYSDGTTSTVNKVRENGQIEEMIRLQGWTPSQLCSTSSVEILVFLYSQENTQSKVVRYSDSTEKQTIQFDDNGKRLYSSRFCTKYISENRNLDICVADFEARAVVVVNQLGRLRFRYTGHSSTTKKQPFKPWGITTDSQCQILTSDYKNQCIHILDQDGRFLCFIDNCELNKPSVLCVDNSDNLFVAENGSGYLKKIKYVR